MQCALQLIGANNSIPLQWQNIQHEFPDIKNDGEFWRIDPDQAHTAVDLCRAAGFTSGGKWRILLLHSALFVAGAVVCLVSGVVKVLWKGIAAVTRRNIWPMFVQMRVFMPAGSAGGCWNTARNTTAFGRLQSTSRTRRPSAFTSTWAL